MEFAIIINEEDRERLIKSLKEISKKNDVFMVFSYAYYTQKGKGENKYVLIDNNGELLIDHSKRYLPGFDNVGETAVFKKGPEILKFADTPYGKITVSVCREMEMEKYIIQAAQHGADIMFTCAYEFPRTWLPNNLQMPVVNGFSMGRPAYNGVSHAQDYNGKILNRMYFEDTNTGIMYADVPTKGVRTLYSYTGKLIGWLSVSGFLLLIMVASAKRD